MPEILAFSTEQVSRVTGISERQLRYWDETDFFSPQFGEENRRRPYSRVYSYRDVVGLRTLALLRNQYKVPLQGLRAVNNWLRQHYDTPWAELTFYIAGKDVFFDDPESGVRIAGRPHGQTVLPIAMQKIAEDTARAVDRLRQRSPEQIGKIARNRHVQNNAWVIAGTRVPTWSIRELSQAGYTTADILRQYPSLTPQDIVAALEHEHKLSESKRAS